MSFWCGSPSFLATQPSSCPLPCPLLAPCPPFWKWAHTESNRYSRLTQHSSPFRIVTVRILLKPTPGGRFYRIKGIRVWKSHVVSLDDLAPGSVCSSFAVKRKNPRIGLEKKTTSRKKKSFHVPSPRLQEQQPVPPSWYFIPTMKKNTKKKNKTKLVTVSPSYSYLWKDLNIVLGVILVCAMCSFFFRPPPFHLRLSQWPRCFFVLFPWKAKKTN